VISFVTIILTVFVIAYAFNQGIPFIHKFTINAFVNNSVNLRSDSPVRIAGIDVGSVQGVSPSGRATKVSFTLDEAGRPIHTDATIRIRDRLFLEGGYYLELDPGSPGAPVAPDGYTIPEAQTASPVQFYQVLSTFDIAARRSLENLLNTLNTAFSPRPGQALSESGAAGFKAAIPQLTPVFKDAAIITRALRGTQAGDIKTFLTSASQVTGTLASTSTQLADLVTSLNRTSSALAATDGALAQSVAGLDQTLQIAPNALSSIDRSLPPLANLSIALDPSLKLAPPILDAITSAVGQLGAIVAPSARGDLLTSLKSTFQQFPALLTQLGQAFPITKLVSDCLQTHTDKQLTQIVPDGPLTTGRPVWQDFLHFLPGVAGATGGFDANGPSTRTLLGVGTNTLSGGALPNVPGIGQLVGSAPPGGSSLSGARPAWVGDLPASVFRPDVPCSGQPIPSLASPTAAPDLRSTRTAPAQTLTLTDVNKMFKRASTAARAVSGP
jgi:virulence factor Mce-like protein